MPKYMVVMTTEDGTHAYFTDDYDKAEQTRMDCECGIGGKAQVYRWVTDEDDKNDPEDSDQYVLWYE